MKVYPLYINVGQFVPCLCNELEKKIVCVCFSNVIISHSQISICHKIEEMIRLCGMYRLISVIAGLLSARVMKYIL